MQLGFLGVEERGVIILAQSNIAVLVSLVRFGVGQSVIRAISENEREIVCTNFAVVTVIQSLIIGILIFILFITTAFFGNHLENVSVYWLISFGVSSLLFSALSNLTFLFHSSKVFLLQTVLIGALNIIFLWTIGKWVVVDINVVLFCITLAQFCVVIFLLKSLPQFRSIYIRKSLLKQLVFDGARSIGWSFIKDLSYKIDLLVFGNILSKYDFGIYSVLQNLCQSVWRVTDSVMASYSKYLLVMKKEQYEKFTDNVILVLVGVTFLALGVAYFLVVPVFGFIAGIDFSEYLFPSLVLLFASLIFNVWKLIANFFIQIGHHISMYITLCSLIGLFCILKSFIITLNEAVVTTASVYLITSLLMIFFYKRVIRMKQFRRSVLN